MRIKLFKILGLQPKAPFVDGDQPISNDGYKECLSTKEMSNGIDRATKLKETRQLSRAKVARQGA